MAKQQSWKQQMYQSIANSQVQQVMQQQRDQGIAQLQAEFDAWQKQQNDIAQLQAEYDSWYAQNNPQPVQSAPVQTVKAAPKQEAKQEAIPSLADFFKPTTANGKDVNKEAAISQAEEREKIQEQKAKRKEAINNTLNMLGTDDFKDMSKKGKAQGVIEQRKAENEAIEKQIAGLDTYNTDNLPQLTDDQKALEEQILNADRYVENAPKERWNNRFLTKQEKASAINNTTQADVDRWLSPETKLTQKEKGIARAYAAAELAKIPTNASTHQPNVQTEEEKQHYRDMVEIMNKTNPVSSAMTGFVELPFNLVDMVGDAGRAASNQISGLGAAVTDKLGITEGAAQRNNERIQAANESANAKEETFRRSIGNAQTQYPGAYTGGKIAGQVTAYALTNPVFDGIAEGAGVTNQLAKFFINQGAQNAQDLALDTAPLVKQLMSDGSMSEEDKREVFNNVVLNALGNAGIGVVQEIPNIAKYAGGKIDARRVADEAFRQNVREGADKLARLAGTEDVDNIVRNATRQAEEATQNIENIARQMPETPQNVPNAVKNAVENVSENVPVRPGTAAPVSPAIENEAEAMAKAMDAEEAAKAVELETPSANNTQIDSKALKKEANNMKTSFREKAKYLGDSDNPYARKFLNSIDEFTNNPSVDTYRKMVSAHDDYMGNYNKDIWKSSNSGYYHPEYHSEQITKRLDDIAEKYGFKNSADNKVMAEDAGIPRSAAPESVTTEIPMDETPTPPIEGELVERGTSRHIRNDGTPMKMEGVSDEVVADFEGDKDMYVRLKNADTKAKAEKIYAESDTPEVEFRDMLRRHDPAALPLGHQLAKDYSAAGNHEAAAQIYREMGEQLTKAGQFSQAAVINMMKNDPLTALNYAQRQIDNLNQQGLKSFGDRWKDLSLTEDEIKMFNNIAPGDEDAIKAAFDTIGERLGKEYPTTFMDKLLEGRKIAMLFNVRTNVRNVGANVPTLMMRWASDRVEALGQNFAHLINPEIEVTQSLTGSGLKGRRLATEVFNSDEVQAMLKNQGGKYEIPELRNSLVQNKQMYKGTALSKWIDNATGGGIQKVNEKLFGKKGVQSGLETIRNATYKLLDLGDSPFVKENFVERLGSYIKAQGISDIKDIPQEAIQTAYEEAMKATYKDNSWAVQMLSGLKGGIEKVPGIGRALSQAAIPFLQAPGNIAARMIDYSPIKATKGIGDIIAGATKNNVEQVSKGIEEAAKGLTGSGLILLGMRLRDAGILTGTYSEDKDQKAFEKQTGFKEFALHIGDKYFTYDWAQPFAEPMIIGTLLADAINKSDEYNSDMLAYIDSKFGTEFNKSAASKALGVAFEGGKASVNSWFNASPLQGLQELLSGGFNGTDIAQNIIDTGVSDFAGGFVPASVNAVAKSMDYTQRNTYDPSSRTNTFINQQIAKIPGMSESLPIKYDTWGREMKYADNQAMATASRFVIPGDYSFDKTDSVDKAITDLYEATKDAAVFPTVAPNNIGDKKLNNEEVSIFQKDMGERSRELVKEFVGSNAYKEMSDEEKVSSLKKLYGLSGALTKEGKFGEEIKEGSDYKKLADIYKESGSKGVVQYLRAKNVLDSADISSTSKVGEAITEAVSKGNMVEAQRLAKAEKDYKAACEKAGVENMNSGTRKAYEEGGVKALQQYVADLKTFESHGVEANETTRSVYKDYGEKGLDEYKALADSGLKNKKPMTIYQSAKKDVSKSELPTLEKYAETYKKIDTGSNGEIDQKEFIAYALSQGWGQSQIETQAKIYGDWKTIPVLEKGTIKFKKKK